VNGGSNASFYYMNYNEIPREFIYQYYDPDIYPNYFINEQYQLELNMN